MYTTGVELKLVDRSNITIFRKVIKGSNEGLKKTDVKCAQLTGMKLSIEPGLDVNHRYDYNMTLLLWAAMLGEEEIGKDLVDKGADVNATAVFGKVCATALHYAISEEHPDVVKLLIKKGADVNAKTKTGYTPLHAAVIIGNEQLIHTILQAGADINAQKNDNGTPLILAVTRPTTDEQSFKIVKHLIEHHKPDVNITDNNGKTVLSYATENGFTQVQNFLKEHGAS